MKTILLLLALLVLPAIVFAAETADSVRAEIEEYRTWVDSFTVTTSSFNYRIEGAKERLFAINADQIRQIQAEIEAAQEQIRIKQEQIEALKK